MAKTKEEAQAKAEEEARVKAEEEARIKTAEEPRAKAAKETARAKAAKEARAKAEEEARFKAEQEARAKAEQEARLKAEQEARLKAEQEARLKAEQEARLKAEQEARAKAEQEARLKAEQEARLKAEQEARLKAEQEARLKAEQEARLKAEQEARAKAEEEIANFQELHAWPPLAPAVLTTCFQTIAAETTDFSKKSIENGSTFVGKLLAAKSVESAIRIQSEYANTSYAGFVAYLTKLSGLYSKLAKRVSGRLLTFLDGAHPSRASTPAPSSAEIGVDDEAPEIALGRLTFGAKLLDEGVVDEQQEISYTLHAAGSLRRSISALPTQLFGEHIRRPSQS